MRKNMLTNSILVLEDNFPDFLILKDHLSDFGFTDEQFYHCYNLEDLKKQEVQQFEPTFIFADLNLGDTNGGFDTFIYVQQMFPAIPVVVFTGIEDDRTALACIQAGAQNFLVKGRYSPEQLSKSILYATERHRLKREMEQLKADYQRIFDENPVAMMLADEKSLQFVVVNKAAIAKYGYSKEEFSKLTFKDLVCKSDGHHPAQGEPMPYSCHYRKSGDVLFVEVTMSTAVYQNKNCLLIAANDVTDKVNTEAAEKRAKQRLEAIFNCANDAILLTNDAGNYVQVNHAAAKLLGYTTQEFLSLSVQDVVMQVSENDHSYDQLWNEFKEEGYQSGTLELKKKDNSVCICHYNAVANIQPGLHLSIVTDITERENSRRKINQQKRRIENILESITDCFFTVDTGWIVTYWNRAAEKQMGLQREKIVGKVFWDVYEEAAVLKMYNYFHKALNEQVSVHFEEFYPGLGIWLDISAYPSEEGLAVYFKNITQKKRLELEVLQTKNNQEALINSSGDLIWSIDKDMKLVSFNIAYAKRMLEFANVNVQQGMQLPLQGSSANNFIKIKEHYEKVLKGAAFTVDEIIYEGNGTILKHAEISFNPILDVNKKDIIGAACYSRNITERKNHQLQIEEKNKISKESEEHLKKVKAELEKIMDSSIDVICTIDNSGNFIQVSAASMQVWGYTPEELIGKNYTNFVDPGYLEDTLNLVQAVVKGAIVNNFENSYRHQNGTSVPMIWSARWDKEEELMFCIGKDASAIKEAERQKAETEQRFSALVQRGADLVGIMDEFGAYKYISPTVKNILGYSQTEITGKNALQFIHPDDAAAMAYGLMKMQEQEERKDQFRFRHANGEWRWLEAIATKLLDNPAIKGIVINSRDITNTKRIEAERESIIKELVKSNADLKQFSFITSHNMRAPLSNILGILRIMDYATLDPFNLEMLEMIKLSTNQLTKTIEDLANILIIKNNVSVEVRMIDLETTFAEIRKTFFNALNDLCVSITTDFEVKSIDFNLTYFESILINLFSNAIKYRSPSRNLSIHAASYLNEQGDPIVTFTDNGTGIDLDRYKDRVFGLYQRFHDDTDGHGLGLFIIKSQIEALGGKIDVSSTPDEGATFTITFKKRLPVPEETQQNINGNSVLAE